jgi:hypothetical protein
LLPHTRKMVTQWGNINVLRTADSNWERQVSKCNDKASTKKQGFVCLFRNGPPFDSLVTPTKLFWKMH